MMKTTSRTTATMTTMMMTNFRATVMKFKTSQRKPSKPLRTHSALPRPQRAKLKSLKKSKTMPKTLIVTMMSLETMDPTCSSSM